jgi:hypothetical protein
MDHLHARLTRLALAATAEDGFVLAGGYAVQAHGILESNAQNLWIGSGGYAEGVPSRMILKVSE